MATLEVRITDGCHSISFSKETSINDMCKSLLDIVDSIRRSDENISRLCLSELERFDSDTGERPVMSITANEIDVIQKSWEKIKPITIQASDLFYIKLFELDPELRVLFKDDIKAQGVKLMKALTFLVSNLGSTESVLPAIAALGARHVGYGVQEKHYDVVGSALLWALDQGLGNEFTDEVRMAWTNLYGLVSSVMIQASK